MNFWVTHNQTVREAKQIQVIIKDKIEKTKTKTHTNLQKREVDPLVEIRFSGSVRISPFDSREGLSRKNGSELCDLERKDPLVQPSIAGNREKYLRWVGSGEGERRKCYAASDKFF